MITRLLLFYTIAVCVSNIFRFDLWQSRSIVEVFPTHFQPLFIAILEGAGIFIGSLIALFLYKRKHQNSISLLGVQKWQSALVLLTPIVLLSVMGIRNNVGVPIHLYGAIVGFASLLYCIMEECGWRGYLEEELKVFSPPIKYSIVGILWFIWHLSFLDGFNIKDQSLFLFILVASSFALGKLVNTTKSIGLTASFHFLIQFMLMNQLLKNGLTAQQKWLVLVMCLLICIIIIQINKNLIKRS